MSQAAVRTAVRSRLEQNWDQAKAKIRKTNESFVPAGMPWIEIRFPGARNSRADLGEPDAAMWEEAGAFMCDVYVPADSGEDAAALLADELAALYQGQDFDNVSCFDRMPGHSGLRQPEGLSGVWYGTSFGIAYRYQSITSA